MPKINSTPFWLKNCKFDKDGVKEKLQNAAENILVPAWVLPEILSRLFIPMRDNTILSLILRYARKKK
jgi:hypothetical protein